LYAVVLAIVLVSPVLGSLLVVLVVCYYLCS